MMRRFANFFQLSVLGLSLAPCAQASDLGLHWREAPQIFKATAERLKQPLPTTIKLKYCTEATCHYDLGDGLKLSAHKTDDQDTSDNLWLAFEPASDKAARAGAAKFGALCYLLVGSTQPDLSADEVRKIAEDFSPATWTDEEREEVIRAHGVRYTGSIKPSPAPKYPGDRRLDCLATRRS